MMNKVSMKRIPFLLISFCGFVLCGVLPVQGANHPPWKVDLSPLPPENGHDNLLNLDLRVYVAAKPIYCLLVEKDRQRLRVLRHDGRLQVVAEYVAATGENFGPKEKEGDAKTPEGVYFITKSYQDRKVSVFGTRAFQLNYPNYFDLRAGRDGYGIFIHGTNKELRFTSSNGCVTLNNSDLDSLADFVRVGTPVLIVASLNGLQDDKGEYPELVQHNFASAKALLIPEASAKTDFASLYLIRIHGQTVLIGEYWQDQLSAPTSLQMRAGSTAPQLAVAYLQEEGGNHWAAVDREPIAIGPQERDAAATASLSVSLEEQAAVPSDTNAFEGKEEPLPWQMTEAERYLAWYREERLISERTAPVLEPESAAVPVVSVANNEPSGFGMGVVYGGFMIATCFSTASAWIFLRRQSAEGEKLAAAGGGERESGQMDLLRDEVKQAVGVLHTVQRRIDEEAMNVESLEAVQTRMSTLEGAVVGKQAEIEQLAAEQALLREQGVEARSAQGEALRVLQRELLEVKGCLAEARQVMDTVASREGMVQEQLAELKCLAESELAAKHGADLQGVVEAFDGLRGQVRAVAEALQSGELHTRQTEIALNCRQEGVAQLSEEVVEALQGYAAEIKGLHVEMAAIKSATESGPLQAVVQELQNELREERASKVELMSKVGRLALLEEELLRRDQQNEALRQESEASRAQAIAQKMDLETTLRALRHELAEVEEAKSSLEKRSGRLTELEAELAGRDREIERLRQEGENHHAQTLAERSELEAALASVRQELTVAEEAKSDLTNRLGRLTELEAELAGRDREIERLRQEGENHHAQTLAERSELEAALASVRQELTVAEEAKSDLTNRLGRLTELEAELAGRDREIERLRQE
ncbi:MAG: L,D-transpeptidase family protein, partial [Desulfobulbaceae bacterium]|nr:L,D-transpeptidase family protein [Desulfobulbaceae bacterium]